MATTVELWMPLGSTYRPALSIPVDTCRHFSRHPLTWMRYLAFTLHGTRGHISTSLDGTEVDDYQADIQPGIYYYVSQDSEAFLLDPDLMDDRTSDTSDASTISTNRSIFRRSVYDRDGPTCVMTGSIHFQACHIVPHAKGHQYMANLANHRGEAIDPPLNNINDTRNGILLATHLQASEVAFLQTPNFAMNTHDVDLVTQPNAELIGISTEPAHATSRLTFQHFNNRDIYVALGAPHNSDARQSDSKMWPPPLFFDVAYGCAALKTWGDFQFMEFARQRARYIYYDNINDHENADDDAPSDQDRGSSQRIHGRDTLATKQGKGKNVCRQPRSTAGSQTPSLADMVLAIYALNTKQAQHQAHATEMDKSKEKVQTWLDSTKQ